MINICKDSPTVSQTTSKPLKKASKQQESPYARNRLELEPSPTLFLRR